MSVWLTSQDFIGLGFNIAGSMRDGIYVSQVHNRGPAIESGKFKVGKCLYYPGRPVLSESHWPLLLFLDDFFNCHVPQAF